MLQKSAAIRGAKAGLRPGPREGETQAVKLQRTGRRDKNRLRCIGAGEAGLGCPVPQHQIRAAQDQAILTDRNFGHIQLVAAIQQRNLAQNRTPAKAIPNDMGGRNAA